MGGLQGSLVPVAAPPRPASKGDKEKASALERSAVPAYQNITNDAPTRSTAYTFVGAGYWRFFKVHVGKAPDKWLLDADSGGVVGVS